VALATFRCPAGLLAVLERRMSDLALTPADAGVSAGEWDAMRAALLAANHDAARGFCAASGVVFGVVDLRDVRAARDAGRAFPTIEEPHGFLDAIQARRKHIGFSQAQVNERAGLGDDDWFAARDALSRVDRATFRKVSEGLSVAFVALDAPPGGTAPLWSPWGHFPRSNGG